MKVMDVDDDRWKTEKGIFWCGCEIVQSTKSLLGLTLGDVVDLNVAFFLDGAAAASHGCARFGFWDWLRCWLARLFNIASAFERSAGFGIGFRNGFRRSFSCLLPRAGTLERSAGFGFSFSFRLSFPHFLCRTSTLERGAWFSLSLSFRFSLPHFLTSALERSAWFGFS